MIAARRVCFVAGVAVAACTGAKSANTLAGQAQIAGQKFGQLCT